MRAAATAKDGQQNIVSISLFFWPGSVLLTLLSAVSTTVKDWNLARGFQRIEM